MEEVINFSIEDSSGGLTKCKLETIDNTADFLLCEVSLEGTTFHVNGTDWYDVFLKMWTQLERSGYRVLCQGARKNVHPSGMARSMSNGRKAYELDIANRNAKPPVVDIFASAKSEAVGTVEEGNQFYRDWLS